jgi:hypothetical protein
MRLSLKRAPALLCLPLLALGLSACAQTVSTSGLNGEAKAAAETIKDLQSNATSGDQKKICQDDLAKSVASRLSPAGGGCQAAIKSQLKEVDSLELTVQRIEVNGTSATAHVTSVYSGKKKPTTMTLVRENGKWKISAVS